MAVMVLKDKGGGGGGVTVFESNWDTATGNTQNAVQDGFLWDETYCTHSQILEVVTGDPVGWTLTDNVLRVENHGEEFCWQIETTDAIPEDEDYVIRMYWMVDDELETHFHAVAIPVSGTYAVPWGIDDVGATFNYDVRFGGFYGAASNWVTPSDQSRDTWYRSEIFIERVDATHMRMYPRLYNMAGDLLFDWDEFVNIEDPGETLQEYYTGGGSGTIGTDGSGRTIDDMFRHFGVGYEGSAGAAGTGQAWFYAGVKVVTGLSKTDALWIGPIS